MPLLVQAFVALTILRSELRSTVPVELVYVGREELPRPTQRLFERHFGNTSWASGSAAGTGKERNGTESDRECAPPPPF